jgi:hypothetical protein
MLDSSVNPLILTLLFVARCLVPIGVLLGLSYLLRRLGLVQGPPPQEALDQTEPPNSGLLHGRP